MDNNKEEFSPEESLRVIQTMIDRTKHSVADKSFYFLLWGWLVFFGAMIQFTLKVIVQTPLHPTAWYIMFIGLIVSVFRGVRGRGKKVKTYVDENLRNIWICLSVSWVLIVFIFIRKDGWENCYTFFILMYSVGCYLTGKTLQFPPLVWGAITCWGLAIVSTFVNYDTNIVILALAILVSYIIPGYLMRAGYKHQLLKQAK
jgi:hypothetical protein